MKEKFQHLFISLGALVFAFTEPIHQLIIVSGALVMIDFVVAITAAIKLKKNITSNRMGHTVAKSAGYFIAILTAFLVDILLMGEGDLMVVKVITSVIGLTEAKSILENIKKLTGFDGWQFIIAKLKRSTNPDKPGE